MVTFLPQFQLYSLSPLPPCFFNEFCCFRIFNYVFENCRTFSWKQLFPVRVKRYVMMQSSKFAKSINNIRDYFQLQWTAFTADPKRIPSTLILHRHSFCTNLVLRCTCKTRLEALYGIKVTKVYT